MDSSSPSAADETSTQAVPESHTSWKRLALFAAPAGVAVGAILLGMANGALAASFSISSQQFKIAADEMSGEGFAQFGWIDATVRDEGATAGMFRLNNLSLGVSLGDDECF